MPQLYQLLSEKLKYPIHSIVSYVQPVTQHYKSRTFQKAPLQSTHMKRKKWCRAPVHLKSEVSITLHCQLCLTRYTAVQIKNCSKSTSANKIVTMKNTDNFHYKGKPSRATTKSKLFTVNKDEWDTKEDIGKFMKNALYILWYAKSHFSSQNNIKQ